LQAAQTQTQTKAFSNSLKSLSKTELFLKFPTLQKNKNATKPTSTNTETQY